MQETLQEIISNAAIMYASYKEFDCKVLKISIHRINV